MKSNPFPVFNRVKHHVGLNSATRLLVSRCVDRIYFSMFAFVLMFLIIAEVLMYILEPLDEPCASLDLAIFRLKSLVCLALLMNQGSSSFIVAKN